MTTGSVEQTADIRQSLRRDRVFARSILWRESDLDRLRACGCRRTGAGSVAVRAIGSGVERTGGIAGLQSCGSVWGCPVCSAKIAAGRQNELAQALGAHAVVGGGVGMVTLTMRHRAGQSLRVLWDALSYAWGKVTSGRRWQGVAQAYGVEGFVRAVEVTHGASGWHVHIHAMMFLDHSPSVVEMRNLGDALFQVWRGALIRKGLAAPVARRGGVDARPCTDLDPMSAYFTKATYKAAAEATRTDRKRARGGNRTPFQILADVVELGDAADLDLWHEWEEVSRGRRQLTWSKGLRDRLGCGEEATDEELAEEAIADERADLALIDGDAFERHVRRDPVMQARLLDLAEVDDGGRALWRYLDELGLPYSRAGKRTT